MACCVSSSSSSPSCSLGLYGSLQNRSLKPTSLSLNSSFPQGLNISIANNNTSSFPAPSSSSPPRKDSLALIRAAAYTRRSRQEALKRPNKKSWKQRTDMYMRPFQLNVFFSKRFVHAKVMHRGTSKVISVATTNARDLRNSLPSLTDDNACRLIGKLIAERTKDADVYAVAFEPRKGEKIEGKLEIVLDTIKEEGILFV